MGIDALLCPIAADTKETKKKNQGDHKVNKILFFNAVITIYF